MSGTGSSGTLRSRAFASGLVVTVASVVMRVLEIVTVVVLARLLEPEHFGAVGLALVVMTSLNLFAQAGMGSAIVQTDADARKAAFNGFLVTGLAGAALFVLSVALAGPLARVLGHPELDGVFRWMALLIPIEMLRVVPTSLLIRTMEFGRQSSTQILGAVAKLTCATVAALLGLGLWSLVIGYLAGAAANTAATLALSTTTGWFRLRHWDRNLAAALARFGLPVLSTGLVRQFYNNADDILIGSLSGTAALGFYRQAYKLGNLPVSGISHAVNTVLFSSYSRLQHQRTRLGAAFLEAFRMVALLTIPVAFGLLLLAHEGVVVALGEKWRPAAPMLMVLAIVSLVRPLSGATGPLFTAIGKPGLNLRTALLQGLSLVPLALLLLRWGPIGIAWAVSLTFTLGFLHNVYLAAHRTGTGLTIGAIARAPARLLAAGGIMGAVLVAMKSLAAAGGRTTESLPALLLLGTAGGAVYLGAVYLLERQILVEVSRLLRRAVRRRAGRAQDEDDRPGQRTPPGLSDQVVHDTLQAWARDHLGAGVATTRCQHLSGWKQAGAFRFSGTTDDEHAWSVVWKEARYHDGDIPALDGLPVRPGPPEFAVYDRAGQALRRWLPTAYRCDELTPGSHYRYLLEDLAAHHRRLRHPQLARVVSRQLVALHAALRADQQALQGDLLTYDRAFSVALLAYATARLHRLAGDGSVDGLPAALGAWDDVRHAYLDGMDRVYTTADPQPIHGDLNPTNVWSEPGRPENLRLVDWEWAGTGIPHSDLVSVLKRATPTLERQALRRYHRAAGLRSWEDDLHAYRWCKLQRFLFDAGFFAAQLGRAGRNAPRLDLRTHVARSLAVVLDTVRGMGPVAASRHAAP